MWQNIAAIALLMFGVIIAIVVVVIYLKMYQKQNKAQETAHNSTSFVQDEEVKVKNDNNEKIV